MHHPHALEHNPDTKLCQEAQVFIDSTKESIHSLLTSPSTVTTDTADKLSQLQLDLQEWKTKLTSERNTGLTSLQYAKEIINAYPTRTSNTTEAIHTTDAALPTHGQLTIHELQRVQAATEDKYETALQQNAYLPEHIQRLSTLIHEVEDHLLECKEMLSFARSCDHTSSLPITLSYDYGITTSLDTLMFNHDQVPPTLSYHILDKKGTHISGPLRIASIDSQTGKSVSIDLHFPLPLEDPLSREKTKITYADTNEPVSETMFPLDFTFTLQARSPIIDKTGPGKTTKYMNHNKEISIKLSLTIPSTAEKKSLINKVLATKGSSFSPNVYDTVFEKSSIRDKKVDKAIENIKDKMPPAFSSFWESHKSICRSSICAVAKNPSLSFDFVSYLAAQQMPGYVGGYKGYEKALDKYFDSLIHQPLGEPLWLGYISSESFWESVIGKWSLMNQEINDPANPSTRTTLKTLYERHAASIYRQYTTLENHSKTFETVFKNSNEYTSYVTDINKYGPINKKVKGQNGEKIPLSVHVTYNNGKFGLSISVDTGQGGAYTIDRHNINSLGEVHSIMYDRVKSLKDKDNIMTQNIGIVYNTLCTMLLAQYGQTALGGLESKSFSNDNGVQGKLRTHHDGSISTVGKFPHQTDVFQVDTSTDSFMNSVNIHRLATAVHLTFAETRNHIAHAVKTNHIATGYGSLTTNPLRAAYDRKKLKPIQCGPTLRLMPTTYGMTWLRGTPPDQEILTTSGQRQEYKADHKAQNIARIKSQTIRDMKHHGEDVRHEGVSFLQNAKLNLIDHNISLMSSMAQLFAVKPFNFLKTIVKWPVTRDSDSVKQSFRELGGEVGNFLRQNIKQFTGLFSLAGATGRFAAKAGTTGYKAMKGGIDYVQGTFGTTVIDPLLKNEQSMDFLLRHLPDGMLDPAHTNTNKLLHHIMQSQIEQKFEMRNDAIRETQPGVANQVKKTSKLNRRKWKNKTSETTGRGMMKIDVQKDLSGGFFVRCGRGKRKIVCLVHDRQGKLIAVELKTSRLTTTFENKLGLEQVKNNESAYKHQERLFHEYDSGVVSAALIQERITEHHKSPGTSPIRNRCEVPPAGETWSSGTLQTIFDDISVWSDFQNITDTGEGHRIAPLGSMTPNHPEPPYDQPFNLPLDLRRESITSPVLNPPSLTNNRDILKPSSMPPHLDDHRIDNEKPTSSIKERINHRSRTPDKIEISIIIDQSGSMEGEKYEAQKTGLIDIMNSINGQGIGNIQSSNISTEIRSGGDKETLLRGANNTFSSIDEQNLINQIDQLGKDLGQSDAGIKKAMKRIYKDFEKKPQDYKDKVKSGEIMKAIYVTTDGAINTPTEINLLRNAGIHVYGIGIDVNEDTIQRNFGKDSDLGGGYCEADVSKLGEKMKEVVEDSLVDEQTRFYEDTPSLHNKQHIISIKEYHDKKTGKYNIQITEHDPQGRKVREKVINKQGGRNGHILDIKETKEASINNGVKSVTAISYYPGTDTKASLSSEWTNSTGIVLDQKQERDRSGGIIKESLIDTRGSTHIDYEKQGGFIKNNTYTPSSNIKTTYHKTQTGTVENISSVIHDANTNTTTTINYIADSHTLRSLPGSNYHVEKVISAEIKTTVNGVTTHHTKQVYDPSGQCIQKLTIENDPTGRLLAQQEQNRDPQGVLINEIITDNRGPIHHTYTKDANHIHHKKIDTNSNICTIYDEQISGANKVITEVVDDRLQNKKSTITQTRNNGHKVSETLEKIANNIREEYIEQDYDSAGNLIKRVRNVSNPAMEESFDAQTNQYICKQYLTQPSGKEWLKEIEGKYNGTEIELSEYRIIDNHRSLNPSVVCRTTFIPGTSNIESFVVKDYTHTDDTFPDYPILMAAIGGEPDTRALAESIFQGGGIRELYVDKTGKIRRLGLDDSNNTVTPLKDIPFVDSVRIDPAKIPLFLATPNGDIVTIGARDITADGIYDITQIDEDTAGFIDYHKGTLSVRP